jgi:GrpB-like predicted nucleotidyltransferase (UPF0157 family)
MGRSSRTWGRRVTEAVVLYAVGGAAHAPSARRGAVSSGWRGWLAFRDDLRTHPEVAREYGELKTRLANEHGTDPNQRDAHRAGKAEWVGSTTTRALFAGT